MRHQRRSVFGMLIAALLIVLWPVSSMANQASPGPSAHNYQECVSEYDPTLDYFPDKVSMNYSERLQVSYAKNYKVVHISSGDAGASSSTLPSDQTILLVQCGTPVPVLKDDLANAAVITVPVSSVAVDFGTDAIFLAALGLEQRIVAVGRGRFLNSQLSNHIKDDQVPELGFPPNLETLVGADPDLAIFFAQTSEDFALLDRVPELGIPSVPSSLVAEASPLGRAEWLKYFALFFNAEQQANSVFTPIAHNYEQLMGLAQSATSMPAVLWAYPENGAISAVQNGWLNQLITDAGATNVLYNPTALETEPLSTETVVDQAAEADFWITGDANSLYEAPPGGAGGIKAYRNHEVYDHGKQTPDSGGNDYYETGAIRVDMVLKDLIAIFHPDLLSDYEPFFFQRTTS